MKTIMSLLLSVLAIPILPCFTSAIASGEADGAQADGGSATASAPVDCEVYFAVEGRSSLDVAVEAIRRRQMPSYVIGTNEHCTVVGYQPAAHPASRTLAKALGLREVPTASLKEGKTTVEPVRGDVQPALPLTAQAEGVPPAKQIVVTEKARLAAALPEKNTPLATELTKVVESCEKQLQRVKALASRNAASQEEVEKAALKLAEAKVELARADAGAVRKVPAASHLKPGDVESAAKKALGETFLKVEGERVFSANVSEFCKGYTFYGVQAKWHSKNPPTNALEEKPLLAISKDATFLIDSYEAALRFLSSFKEPVANEAACFSRCMAFFDLTNGDLRTRMPLKGSIIEMYKKQDPKDWDLLISGIDDGWRVRATASVNKEIDFCIRFEINVGKDGTLSLVSRKVIYAYTLYE